MTDPITFPSTTVNVGLPLLFAGQAQKEFFVNQAFGILDALAPRAIISTLAAPPVTTNDGDCFRISASASGEWSGHADKIAIRLGGGWCFVEPTEGMLFFDRGAGHLVWFRSGWQSAAAPALPTGGTVIDAETRATLGQLVAILQAMGLLSTSL